MATFLAKICLARAQSSTPDLSFPQTNGQVRAIVRSGDTVYIGGAFSSLGGVPRTNLAAFSLSTGAVAAWNPTTNGEVRAMALSGGTIYAGGSFTKVNGSTNRLYAAAFDAASGAATSWNPSPNGGSSPIVTCFEITPSKIYVGGNFATVNGSISRNRVAAFDLSGTATAFNPNVSGDSTSHLHAISVVGSTAVFGGEFSGVNGSIPRASLAGVDAETGAVISWNPALTGSDVFIEAIATSGGKLYVGGGFSTAGGASRSNVAAYDLGTGSIASWNPRTDAGVNCISATASLVYVGGQFSKVNGTLTRSRAAAFNPTDGMATAWNPVFNDTVFTINAGPDIVFAGGKFTANASQPASYIAAFRMPTPTPSPTPSPSPSPSASPSPTPFLHDARFISHTIPSHLNVGAMIGVGVTVQNSCTTMWHAGEGFGLETIIDDCGLTLSPAGLEADEVPPGELHQFVLTLNAPPSTGSCHLTFQMEQNGSRFGESLNVQIQIMEPTNEASNWDAFQ